MQSISTNHAAEAVGPYSQAVMKGNMLFVSGQLGIDPASGQMEQGFEAQANRVFSNVKAILEAAGMHLADVVKVSVFLKDMNDFAALNEIYARNFSSPFPAREAIEVARLPKDGQVEISVIAMR
ncbi:MAG: RidA family protein [Candidatus Syntrophosphaera sp.]|nr:RidA family protein [Candidatus Syntrophosphaera sp.]